MSLLNNNETALDTGRGNEYQGLEQNILSSHSLFQVLVDILRGRLSLDNTTENTAKIQRALAFASVSVNTTPVSVAMVVSEFLLAIAEDKKEGTPDVNPS